MDMVMRVMRSYSNFRAPHDVHASGMDILVGFEVHNYFLASVMEWVSLNISGIIILFLSFCCWFFAKPVILLE